jgi:hypothetical protein
MHPDAAAGLPDAGPDLQELEPQGVDLGRGQFRALEVVAQQPKQTIGRGVQQQPELVGQKAVATQFLPDTEVPFGRLQPYVAVGPGILFSSQNPTLIYQDSFGNTHGFSYGGRNSVDPCLAVDAGIRYLALRNVAIDIFFKYRYAEAEYKFSSFTMRPTYNLFAGGLGVAYSF